MHLIVHFWLCHPALLYGVAFTLGISFHLTQSFWLLIPCLFLWIPFSLAALLSSKQEFLKPLALSFTVFLCAWLYAAAHYTFPALPSEGVKGLAQVKIKNISLQPHIFGNRWVYRCEVEQFLPENCNKSIVSLLPCILIFPANETKRVRPEANQDYWVSSKLVQTPKGSYILKVSTKAVWQPIPYSWSWAEQRYHWKRKVSKWIESRFIYSSSGTFLAGLATGEFDDYWMRQHFARFGLQHLLAISGFHFAIIASFLSFVLRLFLPTRPCVIAMLICLGVYCFFLGPQGSILRAWIMCSLTLMGRLLEKQSIALNSLGFALMMTLAFNPLLSLELGFQLSFAITAAILIFYSPAQAWVDDLLPKRNLSEVLEMNRLSQHAYCVLSFFRQGLALTLAVNAFAFPLTLYYFQQFPWMSLLYNLFFPLLASGSLCLLMLGSLVSFFPFASHFIHWLNDQYTFFILQLTSQPPAELDTYLRIDPFAPHWLVIYLCTITLGAIIWKEKSAYERDKPLTFI